MAATASGSALVPRVINASSAESWSYTQRKEVKYSHEWTINNFSGYAEEGGEVLTSSTFTADGKDPLKWRLGLYPKRVDRDYYLSLFLELVFCNKPEIKAKYKFSILNAKREEKTVTRGVRNFKPAEKWGLCQFKQNFLLDKANILLPEDRLTVFCEVCVTSYSVISGKAQFAEPECRLSEDLGTLFENEKFSDVTLVVGKEELEAHKAVLAARSNVFAAMFEHEMEERRLNRVVIFDVEVDVLKEMLRFIYTGKAPNLDKMAHELLAAADKYALDKLKVMCEKALFNNLSVETAAETLLFADLHNAAQLKNQTLDYINSHFPDVNKTIGWQNMLETHTRLIAEALRVLAEHMTNAPPQKRAKPN